MTSQFRYIIGPLFIFCCASSHSSQTQPALIEFGRSLFFDKSLSAEGDVSCATCHQPERAFTDGKRVAHLPGKKPGTRNTPTLFNLASSQSFFWDGRRTRLEEQIHDPFVNPLEHGFASHEKLLQHIQNRAQHRLRAQKIFGKKPITMAEVSASIAAFIRNLKTADSPFDRYFYGGDQNALSTEQRLGLEIFRGRGQCTACHTIGEKNATFTDQQFHRLGVGWEKIQDKLPELTARILATDLQTLDHLVSSDPEIAELGRFIVTRHPADIGKFKTPSLRNVAQTAPYMHDGSVSTLEEAIEHELYYRGLQQGRPLILTTEEKKYLLAFLRSLTSLSSEKLKSGRH